jgi:outer membrane protein assembly factor BamA
MNVLHKRLFILFLLNLLAGPLLAQDPVSEEHQDHEVLRHSMITIRNVLINGNKKTKEYIIAREVVFNEGQSYSISSILDGIKVSAENLMNTALFVDARVGFTNWQNDSMDIYVEVAERWYYFPLPYLKPADRNLGVWMNDHKMSADRVNYGIKVLARNITGRNDRLNLWAINGFTQRFAMRYYNPFVDSRLRHGWGFDFYYSRNREVNFNTLDNKQLFFRNSGHFIQRQLYVGGVYSYRRGSIERHYLKFGFHRESVDDTIKALNSNYLPSGESSVSFPELKYAYQYFGVNYLPYPTKGRSVEFEFIRRGFNSKIDLTQFNLRVANYIPLPRKFYLSSSADLQLKLPFNQPYIHQPFLGYNDSFLRGLEYFVVDGVAGGFVRNTIGKEIFSYIFSTGLKSKAYAKIPFKFYLKGYGDVGYVYNRTNVVGNSLNNKLMYSGGIGLDIISIYDIVLRFEYSFNQFRQGGLYIHKQDINKLY